jgi:hypothetical protein
VRNFLNNSFIWFVFYEGEAQEAEAIQVLNAILELREQQAVQNASIMSRVYYTVAMLHFVLNDSKQVILFKKP